MCPSWSIAGRISPLLESGNAYSWKLPTAIIVGVVLDWECEVGESIGPIVEVDVYESPQAASKSINSKRKGKPAPQGDREEKPTINRRGKPTITRRGKPIPTPEGDRKGAPLLYTTFAVVLYLLTSEGLTNLECIMEISPVIASSLIIRSEVSLLHHDS